MFIAFGVWLWSSSVAVFCSVLTSCASSARPACAFAIARSSATATAFDASRSADGK